MTQNIFDAESILSSHDQFLKETTAFEVIKSFVDNGMPTEKACEIAKINYEEYQKYVDYEIAEKEQPATDEELLKISQRLIDRNRKAYDELAKNN